MYLFIFDAAPKPLNENIVYPATLAVHANFYPRRLQYARKRLTGELGTLICVEYLWRTITADSFLHTKVPKGTDLFGVLIQWLVARFSMLYSASRYLLNLINEPVVSG